MNDFDRNIRESLLPSTSEWRARAAAMEGTITTMYEEKRKKAALLSWIGSGIGLCFMLFGIGIFVLGILSNSTSTVVAGAMFFLFGDGWMTGSKLVYWTWNSRLQIQRDIKEMHYDLLNVLSRVEAMESKLTTGPSRETQ